VRDAAVIPSSPGSVGYISYARGPPGLYISLSAAFHSSFALIQHITTLLCLLLACCSHEKMAAGGHTSGDSVAGVTIAFTVVAVIGTLLRLYTRFFLNGMGGPDDIVIAVATVRQSNTAFTIITDNQYRH
jgi:hypothetical protein